MAARNEVARRQGDGGTVSAVKQTLANEGVKKRFREVLGAKAPQFMASIVSAVSSSPQLKTCDANSIISAAFVAAALDLPIDASLGFSAIVPYKGNAQFQIMYKGFVQLAIRTGEYEKMNCSVVYADELVGYNPITGECRFVDDFSKCTQRDAGDEESVAGYYAWFRLKSGFTKELYMSRAEVENHARKYSQAYRSDIDRGRSSSKWTTDFDAMGKKTVLKLLLSRWGVLSIDMQKALQDDQKVFDGSGGSAYADNDGDGGEAVIDAFATEADAGEEARAVEPEALPAAAEAPKGMVPGYEMDYEEFDSQLPF